jgi:hypothetical protein
MSAVAPSPAIVQRRRASAAVLVGLPLIAALLGILLGSSLSGDGPHRAPSPTVPRAPARVVPAGDLRFVLPDRWTVAATGPRVPGFGHVHPLYVRSWNSRVAIALLPPASPSLLPPALAAARHPGAPAPIVVRAGRARAYHYALVLGGAQVVDVYTVPTSQGTATVACSGVLYMPAECDLAVSALRLARGTFLPLSADAAFLEALPGVMARLNLARTRSRERLAGASGVDAGIRAAGDLSAAYASADRKLRPLVSTDGDAPATLRVLARLRAAYSGLAGALRERDRAGFERAARTIRTDESRLARSLGEWQRAIRAAAA